MTGPDANTQDTRPAMTTHPLLGSPACSLAHSCDMHGSLDERGSGKVPTQYRHVAAAPVEAK